MNYYRLEKYISDYNWNMHHCKSIFNCEYKLYSIRIEKKLKIAFVTERN